MSNTPRQNTTAQPETGAVAGNGGAPRGDFPLGGGAGGTPRLRSAENGGEQNTTPPPAIERVGGAGRLLAARVDALVVAYRLELDAELYERLELTRQHAALCPGRVAPWEVWGFPFAVDARPAREGEIRLYNADATVLVGRKRQKDDKGNDAGPGWQVEVTLRAAYLATHTHEQSTALVRAIASYFRQVDTDVIAERVRRVDLAADVELEQPFATCDRPAFVGRAKRVTDYGSELPAGVEAHDPEAVAIRTHWRPGEEETLTGFSFAPGGDLMCRLYDKLAQLSRFPENDEKRVIEAAAWARGGYEGGRVWRLEFQFRRPVLEELKISTLEQLWLKVNAIWRYASESWLRMVVPGSATRRERQRLDERWLTYQAARFGAGEACVVKRERAKRGGPDRGQVVGTLQAYLASLGVDADPYDRTRIDPATGLFALKPPEQLWRENLESLARLGDGLGARYVETALAQRARFASSDDDLPNAQPERKAG